MTEEYAVSEIEESALDAEHWPAISPLIESLMSEGESLPPLDVAYAEADRAARRYRRYHESTTLIAAASGAVALGLSLYQVTVSATYGMLLVEAACAGFAVLLIGVGALRGFHHRWLLERHRSERLRLLKFDQLTCPDTWSVGIGGPAGGADAYRRELRAILALDRTGIGSWAGETEAEFVADTVRSISTEHWKEAVSYYRAKRLAPQAEYFRGAATRRGSVDRLTGWLALIAFFAGVALDLIDLLPGIPAAWEESMSGGFTRPVDVQRTQLQFFALALPVFAAFLRIARSAFEFGRNRDRFVATTAALDRALGQLDAADSASEAATAIWAAEEALRSEHREWLRLMQRAEWFG